jgi:hypothetical protein
MKFLGTVKLTQIQRDRLKIGEKPNQFYKPDPLFAVDALQLTPNGVVGKTADGGYMLDAHHANHPNTRNVKNRNGISIAFTFLYNQMKNRFGDTATLGIAGENIIIDDEGNFDANAVKDGATIIIENSTTGKKTSLFVGKGIPPCRPFTRYMTKQDDLDGDELEEHLQFLSNGMRGFYVFLDNANETPMIQAGDKVYFAD